MREKDILVGLHEIEGVGRASIARLMAAAGLEAALYMTADEIAALGVLRRQAELIAAHMNADWIDGRRAALERTEAAALTVLDEHYPDRLLESPQPPLVLYAAGDTALLAKPLVAVVGTRTPTVYGRKVAGDLARDLAEIGFGVVSGLARGIDTAAHDGALAAGGATIAVLGCGIGEAYPPENAARYREIERRGLVLSEYPRGTKPHPGLFPQRNRIIAGLSLGVAVVEAAERSGSLITADMALEASRDVFAVPGPITSPKSRGCLTLIKQGAKLICSAEDIFDEYKHLPIVAKLRVSDAMPPPKNVEMTEQESWVYRILSGEPKTFDALLDLTHYNFGLLHSVLLSLLMKNMIASLPGSAYAAL